MYRVDWDSSRFDLKPVAPAVGPFAGRDFLRVLWHEGTQPDRELVLAATDDGLLSLAVGSERVEMVGSADLTDYHTPLGSRIDELVERAALALSPARWDLDSLPREAAEPVAAGLEQAGLSVAVEEHAVSAVVELPDSFDEYLRRIGKKERHEVRRKRRRYQEVVGELVHETHHQPGWALAEFVRLHKLAVSAKGSFMTPPMERLFGHLAELAGWRIDLLRIAGTDRAAACVFGYADADGYYLYNSSYDPLLSEASPGVVLLGSMIERAVAEGLPRFDFLKGDETYKYRLGAASRPLFRVRAEP